MFQVNAHGKLDYYVNRQHKVANLTSLRDDNGTLHFDARWQEYKELSPQFSGRPPSLLTESSAQTGGNGTEVRCIPVGKNSGGRGQGGNFGLIPDRGFETVALYLQGVPGRHRQEPSAKGEFNLPIASRARGLCAVDGTLRAATTGCPARWEVQMLRCSRAW